MIMLIAGEGTYYQGLNSDISSDAIRKKGRRKGKEKKTDAAKV